MSEVSIAICLLGFLVSVVAIVAIVAITAYNRDKVHFGVQGDVSVGQAKAGVKVDYQNGKPESD